MGRGRPRAAEPDARAVRGDRAARCRRRSVVRRGDAPARRCRHRRGRDGRRGRHRLERDRRRALARRDAGGPARPDGARAGRSGPIAARHAAALSAGRACSGSICWRGSGSAPASPTTWGSARPSRCLRCCWCSSARRRAGASPRLLVAPASLLANWAAEIARFAPSLKAIVAHPSAMPAEQLQDRRPRPISRDVDLVITSYGFSAAHAVARRRRRGGWSCSTRRRRSRTRPPSRPERPRSCGPRRASR